MSGHSKWHNIRVRKTATDARKGKVYTKYARLIEIAAREGGGDLSSNVRLRTLVDSAKSESVPNANIDRAIKKGTGELKGEAMQEVMYEGYGPNGAALLIECLTDNRNRSLTAVKTALSKNGGRFAENGSVLWMFERKGIIFTEKLSLTQDALDTLELELIDHGVEDCTVLNDSLEITTAMTHLADAREFLKTKNIMITSADLQYIPKQTAPLDADSLSKLTELIDILEENDDVSEVHTNAVEG
jgi:YebC/PmpR family DNA-binding regulatory protein